ncbi:MAG: hypothetical protein WBO53_19770, partial [Thermoanaerobaculia bacterium]
MRIAWGAAEIEGEGEDLHLRAAEGAQERIDLVDAANKQGPTEPGASGDPVVLVAWRLRGVSRCRDLAALAARGVGVETTV